MLFNSFEYLIFLPIVFILYWVVPKAMQWFVVLGSSYFFYMFWNPKYVFLIIAITVISFLGALFIERESNSNRKKIIIYFVAFICFGILFLFKYFNFMSEMFWKLLHDSNGCDSPIIIDVILPVGISFYTFQAMGYLIDVYRQDVAAERHFGKYAAFLSFFPQLLAGPIGRAKNLLTQFHNEKKFDYAQGTYGLKLMAWGYFKKIVIADTLAVYVDKIFADLHFFSGGARLVAILFFTIQIYCDFSGYSDIARGTAKLFGIELMINFKSPYFSTSIKEFWQRWHISLSTWFRDYLYIPLGGNRVSPVRNAGNLFVTFLASGIWHGASWTYVAWGGLHGAVQIVEKKSEAVFGKTSKLVLPKWIRIITTFILVSFLWAFFKADTIKDAVYSIVYIFSGFENPLQYALDAYHNLGFNKSDFSRVCVMLLILFLFDKKSLKQDVIQSISNLKLIPRWGIYMGFLILIFVLTPSTSAEFIYFDF